MPERKTMSISEQDQTRLVERVTLVAAILGALSIGLYLVLFLQTRAWQILADAGLVVLAILCLLPARRLARRGAFNTTGYWLIAAVLLAFGGGTLLWSGTGLYNAIGGLLLILFLAMIIRPRRWGIWLLIAILYLGFFILVEQVEPLPRYNIADSAVLRFHVPIVTGALVLLTLWQVVQIFRAGSIRTRLLTAFVAVALLPVALLIAGVGLGGLLRFQQRAIERAESVALLKESTINTWLDDLQIDLAVTLVDPQMATQLNTLTQSELSSQQYQDAYDELESHLAQIMAQTGRYEALFLLDSEGRVAVSTDADLVGDARGSQLYFREGLRGPYIQRPRYSVTDRQAFVFLSLPVVDEEGEALGVLAGRASLDRLNEIVAQSTGLGETAETYLVDITTTLLTPTRSGQVRVRVPSETIDKAVGEQASGSGTYDNYQGIAVVGAYRWISDLQTALFVEQERAEALRPVYVMLGIAAGAGLLGIVLAVGSSLFITRSIATPLAELAETATQIAEGDLARVAPVQRLDEIGTLAQAFNSMTSQFRDLIGSLEHRVAERTEELERRSRYLEATAEVGRAAATILEIEPLIQHLVDSVCQQFNLYYVGLFLVDEQNEWAVLQAGTGVAGQILTARGHRHRIGEGMVGWSIANAEPRIALEAGQDAVRLATPELPGTRSEAALPLRSRDRVLGALTVQHTEPDAFDQETIQVLQSMADQVAVAIDNAHLFAERQSALEAAQRAYGDLSQRAWERILRAQPDLGFRSSEEGTSPTGDLWRPEMERALQLGQTVRGGGKDTDGRKALAVPIKVRGEVIGVLDTYKSADAGDWTSEEIALLEAIADQLDAALESARLYQDTQRRAAREEAIRHVTERMRRAVDVETILQNTVTELAAALGAPRAYVRLGTEIELQSGSRQVPPVSSPPSDEVDGQAS